MRGEQDPLLAEGVPALLPNTRICTCRLVSLVVEYREGKKISDGRTEARTEVRAPEFGPRVTVPEESRARSGQNSDSERAVSR